MVAHRRRPLDCAKLGIIVLKVATVNEQSRVLPAFIVNREAGRQLRVRLVPTQQVKIPRILAVVMLVRQESTAKGWQEQHHPKTAKQVGSAPITVILREANPAQKELSAQPAVKMTPTFVT